MLRSTLQKALSGGNVEILFVVEGQGTAAEFRDKGVFATRQLAKRQITWLRSELDARWFDPVSDRPALERALEMFLQVPA